MMLATFISSIVVYVFIAGEIASLCWFAHDEFILGKGEKKKLCMWERKWERQDNF